MRARGLVQVVVLHGMDRMDVGAPRVAPFARMVCGLAIRRGLA